MAIDTDIEFCMAARTPSGGYTNGITRTQTDIDNIGATTAVHYSDQGGKDGWSPQFYLNIWVADLGPNIGGRATFPNSGPAAEDGVVINPEFFGTTGTAAGSDPYHLGRTTVHEIGHYLNLEHVWGEGDPSCSGNDFIPDTPPSSEWYLGECPEELPFSCNSADMYTNYMYYTNDACMAQFTLGQRDRMRACLMGPRSSLMSSNGCVASSVVDVGKGVELFKAGPNPSAGELNVELLYPGKEATLTVYDVQGNVQFQQALSHSSRIDLPTLTPGIYFLTDDTEWKSTN